MEREITDSEGTTWKCVQAFSGISEDAAQVDEDSDAYWVVCTPSGGAQSVRIQLPRDWENRLSDEEIARAITQN